MVVVVGGGGGWRRWRGRDENSAYRVNNVAIISDKVREITHNYERMRVGGKWHLPSFTTVRIRWSIWRRLLLAHFDYGSCSLLGRIKWLICFYDRVARCGWITCASVREFAACVFFTTCQRKATLIRWWLGYVRSYFMLVLHHLVLIGSYEEGKKICLTLQLQTPKKPSRLASRRLNSN